MCSADRSQRRTTERLTASSPLGGMPPSDEPVSFRRTDGPDVADATLIDGLPGYGMVACIAVRQINDQLGLDRYGSLRSAEHFPVLSYEKGRLRDAVRVYASPDPPVVTLQSDVVVAPPAFEPVGETLLDALEPVLERAIFLVEIPAVRPEDVGRVSGLASSDEVERGLRDAGVPIEAEEGLLFGPTGAVASRFFDAGVPTAVLLVRTATDLSTPDPEAARLLLENALDPLVGLDVDTTELVDRSESIRREMQDIATQVKRMLDGDPTGGLGMYY